jgi:tight adherence protein C
MTTAIRVLVFLVGFRIVVSVLRSPTAGQVRSQSWMEKIGSAPARLGLPSDVREVQPLLDALRILVGRTAATSAERFVGARLSMFCLAVVVGAVALLGSGIWMLPFTICAVVCSHAVPRSFLKARIGKARRAAEADVSSAVDLLASWLGSGITMEAGMRKLGTLGPPSLQPTFRAVVATMDRGVPVHRALSSVALVAGLPSLIACAGRVERNRDLGLPASELLHEMAATMRSEAHVAAKRRAGRRGPLATLVTAMVVAPACVGFLATLLIAGMAGQGLVR